MVFLSVSEKPNKFWKDSKYFLEITYSSTLKLKFWFRVFYQKYLMKERKLLPHEQMEEHGEQVEEIELNT